MYHIPFDVHVVSTIDSIVWASTSHERFWFNRLTGGSIDITVSCRVQGMSFLSDVLLVYSGNLAEKRS